jgi:hypothetical protein
VDDVRNAKKIYQANLNHKRPKGKSKARWKDDVENGIKKVCIVTWKEVAQDRDGWRSHLGGAYPSRIVAKEEEEEEEEDLKCGYP